MTRYSFTRTIDVPAASTTGRRAAPLRPSRITEPSDGQVELRGRIGGQGIEIFDENGILDTTGGDYLEAGSALDEGYARSLDEFDIVYSWEVLHHPTPCGRPCKTPSAGRCTAAPAGIDLQDPRAPEPPLAPRQADLQPAPGGAAAALCRPQRGTTRAVGCRNEHPAVAAATLVQEDHQHFKRISDHESKRGRTRDMCGIVGLYLKRRPVDREDIDAMKPAITHRGPDGDGVLVEGPVGLGMRRLWIIDLKGGWQPIPNETGRISGHPEWRDLRLSRTATPSWNCGGPCRTASDTEAALHAYEEWGGAGSPATSGASLPSPCRTGATGISVVRDRIGMKPLYFAETPGGWLSLGSQSVLASPVVTVRSSRGQVPSTSRTAARHRRLLHRGCGAPARARAPARRPGHGGLAYSEFHIPRAPAGRGRGRRELLHERCATSCSFTSSPTSPSGPFCRAASTPAAASA